MAVEELTWKAFKGPKLEEMKSGRGVSQRQEDDCYYLPDETEVVKVK